MALTRSLTIETAISVLNPEGLLTLLGTRDRHLRRICEALGVTISTRDSRLLVQGDEAAVVCATEVIEKLQHLAERHAMISPEDVERVLGEVQSGEVTAECPAIDVFRAGQPIRPRTAGQARYLDSIRRNGVVLCSGPAGTGKTYLAVAMAVAALKRQSIRKIVLVRPAVEAGESLGFLPGDLQAKINPYLRPLLDALAEMMDHELVRRYTEEDRIEVIPLAYMRGRTLNEAFIILDEAQNTSVSQMKMFLTRMGSGSRMVVSGDTTQVDLPPKTRSGLIDALSRLKGIDGIGTVELGRRDIVRNPLVQKIVDAYDPSPMKRRPKSR